MVRVTSVILIGECIAKNRERERKREREKERKKKVTHTHTHTHTHTRVGPKSSFGATLDCQSTS